MAQAGGMNALIFCCITGENRADLKHRGVSFTTGGIAATAANRSA